MSLNPKAKNQESITTHFSVPCSPEMRKSLDSLKEIFGKSVNEKLREAARDLIEKNSNKKFVDNTPAA